MSHQQRNDKATSKQCLGNGNNNNPAKQRRKKKQRGEPLGLEMVAHPELLAAVTDATTTSTTPIATSTKDCSSQACRNLTRQVTSSSSSTVACNNKTLDDVVMTEVNEHINIVDEDCAEDIDSGDKEVSTYDIDDIEGGDEAYHYSYEYDDESYQSYDLASPYDATKYGAGIVPIETNEGRRMYRERQIVLMQKAEPVRKKLLHAYEDFMI